MGSRKTNFYVDLASRIGFEKEAHEVQSLYLDGRRDEAYNAIPDALVHETSLVGTEQEVAERVERYADAGADRLIVSPIHLDSGERMRTLERLAAVAGVGAPA